MKQNFDPARDGFGFANPVGTKFVGRNIFWRLVSPFLGRGLCFGMVVAAMSGSAGSLHAKPEDRLMEYLSRIHLKQFRLPVLVFVVKYWLASRGGRPEYALRRLRVVGSEDPHIICFGPGMSRDFMRCAGKSHAVAPYRMERRSGEVRVYVYDPNYPGRRNRYITFPEDGSFSYDGFASENGFGLTLVPLSVVGEVPGFWS